MCRLVLAALVAVLLSRAAAALPPPSAVETERLVKQLGADEYAVREAATNALKALGEKSLPALKTAVTTTDDAEVRHRAARIIRVVEAPLEGRWLLVRLVDDGREKALDGTCEVTVADGILDVSMRNQSENESLGVTYTLGRGPRRGMIGLSMGGKSMVGIYKLRGDRLTVCLGVKELPKEFDGKNARLLTLKRLP